MEKALKRMTQILDFIKDPILAILAALIITNFVVVHTKIPTGSMIPTINEKDHMLINRIPFYYRDPQRGEIVIFEQGDINLVKRVIGLPGDVIDFMSGNVYINGKQLDESEYLDENVPTVPLGYSDIQYPYTVPDDSYFVMGDNRTNSEDSRYFGAVSREVIFAKGGLKIFPFTDIGIVE